MTVSLSMLWTRISSYGRLRSHKVRRAASATEPLRLLSNQTEMKVDTSSWRGELEEDDASWPAARMLAI
jgi:hypothetical protein